MLLVKFQTADLFAQQGDTPPLLVFESAFASWVESVRDNGQLTRETSVATYSELWSLLIRWCLSQDPVVRMDEIDEAALEACIASRHGAQSAGDDLSPRYVWRLLHLVDRVLAHHAREHNAPPNRAAALLLASRPDWRYANAAVAEEKEGY